MTQRVEWHRRVVALLCCLGALSLRAPATLAQTTPADPQDLRWLVAITMHMNKDANGLEPFIVRAAQLALAKTSESEEADRVISSFRPILASAKQIQSNDDLLKWFRTPAVSDQTALDALRSSVVEKKVSLSNGRLQGSVQFPLQENVQNTVVDLYRGNNKKINELVGKLMDIPQAISVDKIKKDLGALDPTFADQVNKLIESPSTAVQEGTLQVLADALTQRSRERALAATELVLNEKFGDSFANAVLAYKSIADSLGKNAGASVSEDLKVQASIIGLLGQLSNDEYVAKTLSDASRAVQTATEVVDACALIATGTTAGIIFGVVALASTIVKADQAKRTDADPTTLVLSAIKKVLEYLQAQFLVVNSKLDIVIDQVLILRRDVEDLKISIAEVNSRLQGLEKQATALSIQLGDVRALIIRELNEQKGNECRRWATSGNALSQANVESCLSEYARWAKVAYGPAFVRIPNLTDPAEAILRDIFGQQEESPERLGRGLLALSEVFSALAGANVPVSTPLANPFVLWTASEGYLAMATRYPNNYGLVDKDLRREDRQLFIGLVDHYNKFLNNLRSATNAGAFSTAVQAYKEAAQLMLQWLDAAVTKAAAEEFEDLSREKTNLAIPEGLGECNGRIIPQWKVFSENDVRSANPRLARLFSTQVLDEVSGKPISLPFKICIKSWSGTFYQLVYGTVGNGCCDTTTIKLQLSLGGVVIADDLTWEGPLHYFDKDRRAIDVYRADPLLALSRMNLDPGFNSTDNVSRALGNTVIRKLSERAIIEKATEIQLATTKQNRLTLLRRVAEKISKGQSVGPAQSPIRFETVAEQLDTRAALIRGLAHTVYSPVLDSSGLFRAMIVGRDPIRIPDSRLINHWAQCAIVGIGRKDKSRAEGVWWDLRLCTNEARATVETTADLLKSDGCISPRSGNAAPFVDAATGVACEPKGPNGLIGDLRDILRQRVLALAYLARDPFWAKPTSTPSVELELIADGIGRLQSVR